MPVTNYISVNGRMLSEITDGVILDYVPDALGSIQSVVDQTATAVKTMRYKPYGEVLSRSGSISDRMYQWVGTYGYRATFNYASSHYVRARHYSQTPGAWTTVDPLWPDEASYGYVGGRSCRSVDPSGRQSDQCGKPLTPCVDILTGDLTDFPQDLLKCLLKAKGDQEAEKKCIQNYGKGLKGKIINNLLKYIACVVASEDSGGLKGGGKRLNPCSDRYNYGLACCHMEYLYCMMKCLKNKHNDVGLGACLGDCYIKATKCASKWNEHGD